LPNPESERRELARRSSAGVDVTLCWHPTLDELIVRVCDERHGAHFEIRPQRYLALTSTTTPTHTPTSQACTKRRTDVPPRDDLERSMADQPWMLRLQPPPEGRQ
jgi:hypothetical protein